MIANFGQEWCEMVKSNTVEIIIGSGNYRDLKGYSLFLILEVNITSIIV